MIDKVIVADPNEPMFSIDDKVWLSFVEFTIIGVEKTPIGFKYKLKKELELGCSKVLYGIHQDKLMPMWDLQSVPSDLGLTQFIQDAVEEWARKIIQGLIDYE